MALPHEAVEAEVRQAWRDAVAAGYVSDYPEPQLTMLVRYAMAVGYLESSYGYGWAAGKGAGSNNMGAITAGAAWTGETFSHEDSTPTSSYVARFRVYPSRVAGWVDLIRQVYRGHPDAVAAAREGDTRSFSQAMYDAHYYTGTSTTPSVNVDRHATAVARGLAASASVLGPLPSTSSLSSGASRAIVAMGTGLIGLGLARIAARRLRNRR